MKHEKIIRRDDGSRVKIEVEFTASWHGKPEYSFSSALCEKGKRTWKYPHSSDDYKWRALDAQGRNEYSKNKYLTICSMEEVMEVYRELWEMISPDVICKAGDS